MTAQRLGEFDAARRDASSSHFCWPLRRTWSIKPLTARQTPGATLQESGTQAGGPNQEEPQSHQRESAAVCLCGGKALITAKEETQDAYAAIESVLPWERFVGTVQEAEQLSITTEVEILVSRYPQLCKYTKELLKIKNKQL